MVHPRYQSLNLTQKSKTKVQKSKTEYQWQHKKYSCPLKNEHEKSMWKSVHLFHVYLWVQELIPRQADSDWHEYSHYINFLSVITCHTSFIQRTEGVVGVEGVVHEKPKITWLKREDHVYMAYIRTIIEVCWWIAEACTFHWCLLQSSYGMSFMRAEGLFTVNRYIIHQPR